MKKTVITLAVVAFAAAAVQAQTTSANIVGYSKSSYAGGFFISANQFLGSSTVSEVYGDSLPANSKVYTFDGSSYTIASYGSVFVPGQGLVTQWDDDLSLSAGVGYWVETPSATEAVVSGEVESAAAVTNSISAGFQLVSYPYPVEVTVEDLDLSPASGDKVYVWDGTGYTIVSYGSVFVPGQGLVTQWDSNPTIGVGQGFWYETATPQEWVANKPF